MSEKVDYEEHVDLFEKISYGSASSVHVYLSGIGLGVIDIPFQYI